MTRRLPFRALPALFALAPALASLTTAPPVSAADPTLSDCISANESSLQARADHKLRQARAQSLMCASDSCPSEMRDKCKQRVEDLNRAIPTIVFAVQDAGGADLGAVKVSMDGQLLADRLEGTAISLDPGEHKFKFEVPGQAPIERTFILREGEKDRKERIVVGQSAGTPETTTPATGAAPATATTTSASPAGEMPPVEQAPPSRGGSNLKMVGLVVGGVGVAGLIAGGVFGGLASSSWSSSKNECASAANCPNHAQAVSDHDSATTMATASTVTFIVGGIALATGAVLFLTAPSNASGTPSTGLVIAPAVGPGSGGLLLKGTF
jgi:hypothetical protein